MRTIALVLLMTMGASRARAAEPVLTIVAPAKVQPGSVVRVELVGLNPAFAEDLTLEANAALAGTFKTSTASFPVTLKAESGEPMNVQPRGFAVRTYEMTVPDAPDGEATLVVVVGNREVAAATLVVRDGAADRHDPLAASPALDAFPRTLPGRLAIHNSNYFIYGTGGAPAVKFQLSFKYRVLTFGQGTPERPPPALQLAYTQRSLWDVNAPSSPFYDTSYSPEIFVEHLLLAPARTPERPISFLGWAAGYRHESNGKDGPASRSYDILYVRTLLAAGSPASWYLAIAPEAWGYLPTEDSGNSDIATYRGYCRLLLVGGYGSGPSLAWSMTPEHQFQHVTHQLDLSIPVGIRKLNLATFVLVQYFDGYAESLRNYTQQTQSLRVGLSLVR